MLQVGLSSIVDRDSQPIEHILQGFLKPVLNYSTYSMCVADGRGAKSKNRRIEAAKCNIDYSVS